MIDSILPFFLAKFCMGYGTAVVPRSSIARPILLSIIVVCCLISVRSTVALKIPGGVARDYIIGYIFHASNFLCVSKVYPPTDVRTPKQRFWWGMNQIIDGRWGITYFPPFDEKDKQYVPTRRKLFLIRLRDFILTASLAYFLENYDPLQSRDYVSPNGFFGRITDISRRELAVRAYFVFAGLLIPYLGLRAAHSLTSCVALASGDSPERWPPLFGSLSDAYTVRRWYSLFWHRAMRKAFTSHAVFIVNVVLRMPRKSQLSRYLITVITFTLLAIMHLLTCPGMEICMIPAQLAIHVGTAVAIILEDGAIGSYRIVKRVAVHGKDATKDSDANGHVQSSAVEKNSTTANTKRRRHANAMAERLVVEPQLSQDPSARPSLPLRMLGFTWVATFWTWSVSNLMYDLYQC